MPPSTFQLLHDRYLRVFDRISGELYPNDEAGGFTRTKALRGQLDLIVMVSGFERGNWRETGIQVEALLKDQLDLKLYTEFLDAISGIRAFWASKAVGAVRVGR
jgi:hypothetical protein